MTTEILFSVCNAMALSGWILLVLAPRWRWTTTLVTSILIPMMLAAVYVVLVATNLGSTNGGFGSLAAIGTLFETPSLLLAGWVHYLAFDLFVGTWQVRDSQRIGIRHLAVVPCLAFTFLLGPTGLLAYLVLRMTFKRQFSLPSALTPSKPNT